jgi:broad specificity phosphatase PhoE
LNDAGISVIYGTEMRRTTQTAELLAKALNIDVKIHPRRDMDGLISRLRTQHAHDRVLIVSHSLRVPRLLKALGYPQDITIASKEYDNLFVIIPKSDGAPLVLRLRYPSGP